MLRISDDMLQTVTGGKMKPSPSGIIESQRNGRRGRRGGVTVDWHGENQFLFDDAPTDGVFPYNGGDGSNGQGGWAIGDASRPRR